MSQAFAAGRQPGADTVLFEPEYMFEKKKILEHQKNLEARITRLIRPMQSLSGPEKAIAIHDFICSQVTYDKLKKGYSHEIIGPLQQGIGVCEGIAKTIKCFCDRLGIDCIIAICEADPGARKPISSRLEYMETGEDLVPTGCYLRQLCFLHGRDPV